MDTKRIQHQKQCGKVWVYAYELKPEHVTIAPYWIEVCDKYGKLIHSYFRFTSQEWALWHREVKRFYQPGWQPKTTNGKTKKNNKKRRQLLKEWNQCCYCLEKLCEEAASLDHILPRSIGGSNRLHNLALSCKRCNTKKGREWRMCHPDCPEHIQQKFLDQLRQYPHRPAQ